MIAGYRKHLRLLEHMMQEYAQHHAKPHHRQINKTPLSRTMLYIPMPQLRAFAYPYDLEMSWQDRIKIFQQTSINECQIYILLGYHKLHISILIDHSQDLYTLIEACDNRRISDNLSAIYARIGDQDNKILDVLSERNQSANPWKRRQSLVSLYYYAKLRKRPFAFEDAVRHIQTLWQDPDYYVQKGLGWTLRELLYLYPRQTRDLMLHHVHEIHPRARQASTEKLSLDQKMILKAHRKSTLT